MKKPKNLDADFLRDNELARQLSLDPNSVMFDFIKKTGANFATQMMGISVIVAVLIFDAQSRISDQKQKDKMKTTVLGLIEDHLSALHENMGKTDASKH